MWFSLIQALEGTKMSKADNLKGMIEYPKGGILSKVISSTGNASITLFCMAGGTEISEHTASRQGFVLVLEGRGTFTLSGRDIQMIPSVFIELPKSAPHSLRAEEDTAFLLCLSG